MTSQHQFCFLTVNHTKQAKFRPQTAYHYNHSVYVSIKNKYIYGEEKSQTQYLLIIIFMYKKISDELWKFSTNNNIFMKCHQSGNIPKARYCHTEIIFDKKYLIIYAGINHEEVFNDWYVLDLENNQWAEIQTNIKIQYNLQPKIISLDSRGLLFISQVYNIEKNIIESCCKLYEIKIRFVHSKLKVFLQEIQIYFQHPIKLRNTPSLCKYYKNNTLYLAIIGGQTIPQSYQKQKQISKSFLSDTYLLNLQTFQCKKSSQINLTTKLSTQPIFYKDRILLIGGITSLNQFNPNLQVIDLQFKKISIDRKLCKTCQIIYGLEDYNKDKLTVKVEYNNKNFKNSGIPNKLIQKFSQFIQNPIKAIGLFLDNSMNLNASMIEIKLKKIPIVQKLKLLNDTNKVNYTHNLNKQKQKLLLQITDNSFGFSKQQILQSFLTFGYKTQTFTHDVKFQQQLSIRKQYGLNLKLASIRLGKACLFFTSTIQNQKFIGYFSTYPNQSSSQNNNFNCIYYFINQSNEISSIINRKIIQKNIQHYINLSQLQKLTQTKTKVFVFQFNKKEEFVVQQKIKNNSCKLKLVQQQHQHKQHEQLTDLVLIDQVYDDQLEIFNKLSNYIKYLYLKPYIGRTIKLLGKQIVYDSILQRLKQDQLIGQLQRINLQCIDDKIISSFQTISLYKNCKSGSFQNQCILIYSSNRLIDTFSYQHQLLQQLFNNINENQHSVKLCGVIQLPSQIPINLAKCGIQNLLQKKQIKNYILKIIKYVQEYKKSKKDRIILLQEKSMIILKIVKQIK